MLLKKIEKELIKRRPKLLYTIENDDQQYLKLKTEYEALPLAAKNKLPDIFKTFILLNSLRYEDIIFSYHLIKMHHYEQIEDVATKFALGRFYAKFESHPQVIGYFLPLFNDDKFTGFNIADLVYLLHALHFFARHSDCKRVIEYALKNHSQTLGWNIEILNYQIETRHLYPNNQELIVENLKLLYPRCETYAEYNQLALCFFNAGYMKDALKMYDSGFQKLTVTPRIEINAFFDSSECRASMDEIIDLLEINNIPSFPVYGSLLGLVRDGKFMEYDKDADVGIFVESYEDIHKIVSVICQTEKFISPDMVNNPKEKHTWCVTIFDSVRKTTIDLFFYYRKSTHIESGVCITCGVLKWQFSLFDLERRLLAGKAYWVPSDTDKYLTELYEDWHKPVEVWDSLLNCPNLMPSSQPVVIYFGLLRLYNTLVEGRTKKALNYYETLTKRWGMRFSPEADMNIQKILSENIQ